MILNESKFRIEDTRYLENFNFLVFSTRNLYLYDLRYPHFAVSEIPININFKGMEIKEVEIFGDDFLDTKNYFSGIDITYKDNAHLLFDLEICNQIILKNEKDEQEKEDFEIIENYNVKEEFQLVRRESEISENDLESSFYKNEKKFPITSNQINVNSIPKRSRSESAIEIDEDSSSFLSHKKYNVNNINNKKNLLNSVDFSNLNTDKKPNQIENTKSSSYWAKNKINETSHLSEEDESESIFNNKRKDNQRHEESYINNDNDSLNDFRFKNKKKINENVENLDNAFNKNLHIDNNLSREIDSLFDKDKKKILNSDFFVDFCDLNLIKTFRDINDIAGFLYCKADSDSSLFNFDDLNEDVLNDHTQSNEIFTKLFFGKNSSTKGLKNPNKYYINFAIDQFAGINCYIHKIINTNNFSKLTEKSSEFKRINRMFIDFDETLKKEKDNEEKELFKNENEKTTNLEKLQHDPLSNLYDLYKKFYISNIFDTKHSKVNNVKEKTKNQNITDENNDEGNTIRDTKNNHMKSDKNLKDIPEISKDNEKNIKNKNVLSEDIIKYSTNNLNKIKTIDLNHINKNKQNENSINIQNTNEQYSNDLIMKNNDEESVSELSEDSFNDLIDKKSNKSSDENSDLVENNNDIINFGKVRVNGRLLKMYDLVNKRDLLEKILLEKPKENSLVNCLKNIPDVNYSEMNNEILSNNNNKNKHTFNSNTQNNKIFNNKNIELNHSYSSENFFNFHEDKLSINNNISNFSGNINTPKSTSSAAFGFDRKHSENTIGRNNNIKSSKINSSFNLNLNLNYTEKKVKKINSENNIINSNIINQISNKNHFNNFSNKQNLYENINEDDEYDIENLLNEDSHRENLENTLDYNQGFSAYNFSNNNQFNITGSQNEVLNILFDKLKNEK